MGESDPFFGEEKKARGVHRENKVSKIVCN